MLNTTYPMHLDARTINGEPVPAGWQAQHALSAEVAAAADGDLDARSWGTLLSAIRSGLPVVLVTNERHGHRERKTVIVQYAHVAAHSTYLRVSYWGFTHNLYVSDIESVSTPDMEFLP